MDDRGIMLSGKAKVKNDILMSPFKKRSQNDTVVKMENRLVVTIN